MDNKEVEVLSKQYEIRGQLLTEILKLYFRLLLAIAIAFFAGYKAVTSTAAQATETAVVWATVEDQTSSRAIAAAAGAPASGHAGAADERYQHNAQEFARFVYLLAPYAILAWFAGYLFLFWNYEVVITEMDCIASDLEKSSELRPGVLSHRRFLAAYCEPKFLFFGWWRPYVAGNVVARPNWIMYGIIALPILGALIYLGTIARKILTATSWSIPYFLGLACSLAACFAVHGLFVRRITRLGEAAASNPRV